MNTIKVTYSITNKNCFQKENKINTFCANLLNIIPLEGVIEVEALGVNPVTLHLNAQI